MRAGDAEHLGALMTAAQKDFDTADSRVPFPIRGADAAAVLGDEKLAELCWGGKGIGCGGEGSRAARLSRCGARRCVCSSTRVPMWVNCCALDVGVHTPCGVSHAATSRIAVLGSVCAKKTRDRAVVRDDGVLGM